MDGDNKKPESTEPATGWQYTPQEGVSEAPLQRTDSASKPTAPAASEGIEWTASEFAAHQKNASWYIAFGLVGLVIAAGLYLITRDLFSVFIISALVVIVGTVSARKPRVIAYRLDRSGFTTGTRLHPFSDYRSFVIVDEGPFSSITLMPSKRFMPPLSAYLSPEDEQRIVTFMASYLPLQPGSGDGFDSLLRKMRF